MQDLFEPRRSAQQNLLVAVSDQDPDTRRDSVAQVAHSDERNSEWAIKGFIAIALLESDSQARCVAIRGLSAGSDPRCAETLLKILNYREYPPAEVRPPDGPCRWDAVVGLDDLTRRGQVPANRAGEVRTTLLVRLQADTDRNVRIAAAHALAGYPSRETLEVLIETLRDNDFALVRACEDSLSRLTGVTHHCNAMAWSKWLRDNPDPAMSAHGSLPSDRQRPYDTRWEKLGYDTRQFIQWLAPGAKPK